MVTQVVNTGVVTQARGTLVDKRTDVWAFGCLLYELRTGQKAFRAETVSDTLAKVRGPTVKIRGRTEEPWH